MLRKKPDSQDAQTLRSIKHHHHSHFHDGKAIPRELQPESSAHVALPALFSPKSHRDEPERRAGAGRRGECLMGCADRAQLANREKMVFVFLFFLVPSM